MSVNPFDPKTIVPAKHAQHVVLIHYPIALFLAGVAFDFLAQQKVAPRERTAGLKGTLLEHLVFARVSTVMIWLVWWVHFRS
jgi:uncharacterized membrane protein